MKVLWTSLLLLIAQEQVASALRIENAPRKAPDMPSFKAPEMPGFTSPDFKAELDAYDKWLFQKDLNYFSNISFASPSTRSLNISVKTSALAAKNAVAEAIVDVHSVAATTTAAAVATVAAHATVPATKTDATTLAPAAVAIAATKPANSTSAAKAVTTARTKPANATAAAKAVTTATTKPANATAAAKAVTTATTAAKIVAPTALAIAVSASEIVYATIAAAKAHHTTKAANATAAAKAVTTATTPPAVANQPEASRWPWPFDFKGISERSKAREVETASDQKKVPFWPGADARAVAPEQQGHKLGASPEGR